MLCKPRQPLALACWDASDALQASLATAPHATHTRSAERPMTGAGQKPGAANSARQDRHCRTGKRSGARDKEQRESHTIAVLVSCSCFRIACFIFMV